MADKLDTAAARERLRVRPDPYTHRLARGLHVLYRRTSDTWGVKYRSPDGATSREWFGTSGELEGDPFEAAVAKAWQWRKDLEGPTASDLMVHHAISGYLTKRYNDGSEDSYRSTRSFLHRHILPQIGHHRIAKLRTAGLIRWRDRTFARLLANSHETDPVQRDRKSRQATNYVVTLLKAALNSAHKSHPNLPQIEWKNLERLPMPKGRQQPRMLILKDPEPQFLLNACEDDYLRDVVAFALLTGARPGEIYRMLVGDYDRDRGEWDLRAGKTGPRTVTLSADACALLDRVSAGRPKDAPMFTRADGEPWTTGRVQHPFKRAVKRAGLDPATCMYTARHTVISRLLTAGMPSLAVAQEMGTSLEMLQQNYAKFMRDDRRAMIERGGIKISTQSNVARLPHRA